MNNETSQSLFSRVRSEQVRLVLMASAAVWSLIGYWQQFLPFDVVAVIATFLGGYPIYKETFRSLRHRRINMEVSMTVAVAASLIVGAFTAAIVIAFFVILAEYIESYATDSARATLIQLEKAVPRKALVRRNGIEIEVDPQTLTSNDLVIVRDGERVPVDGVVIKGDAYINQASITGESIPVEKHIGDGVFAGTINESGLLEVQTEKIGTETVFGKIIKLVGEAESKKAPIQKISDRLAVWLVEFAIGSSLLAYLLTRNPISAISVVVVAGSCGVAAGTPLAIVAAMGKAAKKGVIVKGGVYIEEMTKVDTIVIDKTGTLTLGEPTVQGFHALDGCSEKQILSYAASAEKHSTHPIARAIVRRAAELGIRPIEHSQFDYSPGKGVTSEHDGQRILVGNNRLMSDHQIELPLTVQAPTLGMVPEGIASVLVAHDGKVCGTIWISDTVREESKLAISELKKMGIKTIMLTGDNKGVAKAVGSEVGVDDVYAELLPQDKVSKIEELVANGRRVAMVGDGVNDAPALARASVGIGMGTGTDVAVEEADVVLMTNDLSKIAGTLRLSKKAYHTIMENFYGTIIIDGIGVTLAFLGFLNPLSAAVIHTASELVFIANSARLMT
jgi:heavy metal translocating P-type ATPase